MELNEYLEKGGYYIVNMRLVVSKKVTLEEIELLLAEIPEGVKGTVFHIGTMSGLKKLYGIVVSNFETGIIGHTIKIDDEEFTKVSPNLCTIVTPGKNTFTARVVTMPDIETQVQITY